MSNETKDKTAAETVADDVMAAAEGTAQAIAANADKVAAVGKAIPEAVTEAVQKAANKGKKPAKSQSQESDVASALHAVGKAACKRHGLPVVWVTADGQCFKQENDARNHGKSLGLSAEPLKVEA